MTVANATKAATAVAVSIAVAGAGVATAVSQDAAAAGHSGYSFKRGKNCVPGPRNSRGENVNILDPVTIQMITNESVSEIASITSRRSERRNPRLPFLVSPEWPKNTKFSNDSGQQSSYFSKSGRVCSAFSQNNATGNAARSRYHVRWHTGGESSSFRGRRIVAGTPHYDILCFQANRKQPAKHEIRTFAGARTQLAKLYPRSAFRQYIKFAGNTHRRYFPCTDKWVKSDGYILYVFV